MLERYVLCPRCKTKTLYSVENKFRPFCSERCRIIDLGDWASENFKIPLNENSSETIKENQASQASPDDEE